MLSLTIIPEEPVEVKSHSINDISSLCFLEIFTVMPRKCSSVSKGLRAADNTSSQTSDFGDYYSNYINY